MFFVCVCQENPDWHGSKNNSPVMQLNLSGNFGGIFMMTLDERLQAVNGVSRII